MSKSASASKGSILFVSKRRDAASTRYRIFQYQDYLEQLGWSVDYLSSSSGRLILFRRASQADVVVIQRKLFDAVTLRLLKRCNPNLVFDYDDAIFLNDDGSTSARRRRRFDRTTRMARLNLAGNSYLAAASSGKATVLLPTTVEMSRYSELTALKPDDALTLVWIGSRSTSKYLELFRPSLEAIGREVENVRLKVVGDFEIDFAPLQTDCVQWSSESEVQELASSHVGIAPMTDDPWTRGKCALKVIQYMACGLPVISSKCGANAEVISEGETGFLVSDDAGWINSVRRLQNQALRQQMGSAARKRAEETYSAQATAARLNELFSRLLEQEV